MLRLRIVLDLMESRPDTAVVMQSIRNEDALLERLRACVAPLIPPSPAKLKGGRPQADVRWRFDGRSRCCRVGVDRLSIGDSKGGRTPPEFAAHRRLKLTAVFRLARNWPKQASLSRVPISKAASVHCWTTAVECVDINDELRQNAPSGDYKIPKKSSPNTSTIINHSTASPL